MSETKAKYSQEQLSQWVKEQFQRANKHLAENGVIFESVTTEECRYLAPIVALWKIKSTDQKFYWVVSGDVPSDFMAYQNEPNARDALRRFSFLWQMKAEELSNTATNDMTQMTFANYLREKAEVLYDMYSQEGLWQNEPT